MKKFICFLICLPILSCQQGNNGKRMEISSEQENVIMDSIFANKENFIFLSYWPGIDADIFDYVSRREVEKGNLFQKDANSSRYYYNLKYGNESKEFVLDHYPESLELNHSKSHSGPNPSSQGSAVSISNRVFRGILNLFKQKYGEPEIKIYSPKFNRETVSYYRYYKGEHRYEIDSYEYHIFRASDRVITINKDNYFSDMSLYTRNQDGSINLGSSSIAIKYYSPSQYIQMNRNRLLDSTKYIREMNAMREAEAEDFRRKRQEVLDQI